LTFPALKSAQSDAKVFCASWERLRAGALPGLQIRQVRKNAFVKGDLSKVPYFLGVFATCLAKVIKQSLGRCFSRPRTNAPKGGITMLGQPLPSPLVTPQLTWERALEVFLEMGRLKNLAPRTLEYYQQRLSVFAKFAEQRGETPLTYSKATILDFIAHLGQRLKPPTLNSYLRAIKAFTRWLLWENFRTDDPMRGVAMLKEGEQTPRTLTDDQVVALMNAFNLRTFEGLRNYAFVGLALDTGLRLNELLNLQVSDIDFATNSVLVRHAKGNKVRVVPFSPLARRYLLDYLSYRALIAEGSPWLWVTRQGTRPSSRSLREVIERAAKRAGIEGVRVSPHTFRYTFARKWLEAGGDSIMLQRLLGHSSPAIVSHYARLFRGDLAAAHRRFSPLEALSPRLRKRLR
jgi:integrase/recombinase XerD